MRAGLCVVIGVLGCLPACGGGYVENCNDQRQITATTRLTDSGDTVRVILHVTLTQTRGTSQTVSLNIQVGTGSSFNTFQNLLGVRIMAADTATVYYTVPVQATNGGTCCALITLPDGTIPVDALSAGQLLVTFVTGSASLSFAPSALQPSAVGDWTRVCGV